MSKAILIKAKEKENKNPNSIRREGYVPATVYGHSFKSISVQVNAKEFSTIPHREYSHINELELEGKEKFPIIIRNVQKDPVRDNILNIEFYKINEKEKIKIRVPLNYTGHSEAVTKGGILIVSLTEVDIQCLPKDIPDMIDIDLGVITEIGQALHAGDLKVSEGITIINKKEEVLAKVEVAKTHEVETAQPTVAATTAPGAPATATAEAPKADAKEAPKADAKPAKK